MNFDYFTIVPILRRSRRSVTFIKLTNYCGLKHIYYVMPYYEELCYDTQ